MNVLERKLNNADVMQKRARSAVEKAYWKGQYDVLKWILDKKEKSEIDGKDEFEETRITFNGRSVRELEFHMNGEFLWMRFMFKDGSHQDTYVFKGGL